MSLIQPEDCPCCLGRHGESLHTCYEGHACDQEPCEWCGHALGVHKEKEAPDAGA